MAGSMGGSGAARRECAPGTQGAVPGRRWCAPGAHAGALAIRAALALAATILGGCGGGGSSNGTAGLLEQAPLSAQAELGREIFSDPSLPASGRLSCASCHDEASGHAPPNALAVQLGGPLLDQQGTRKAPSIRYLATNAAFFFDGEGTPTGGFFWDGRSPTLQDQATHPLLAPNEMANADPSDAVARLSRAAYADEFRRLYGGDIFDRPDAAFAALTLSLQAYQREDIEFRGYTSKYDEFLRGNVRLTDQELRGLALFNDPVKGNCQACHPSARGADGSFPLFTDFTYDNLGVPRNPEIATNADPAYFDLGLCGRPDLAGRTDLCGAFKVPSLRNVGLRQAYFHNGRFKTLKDVVTFYVQRDTNPEKWYPLDAAGQPLKFDDLPPAWHGNVNTSEVPYNRRPGDAPALSDAEVDDVVAFLRTLSDGWRP